MADRRAKKQKIQYAELDTSEEELLAEDNTSKERVHYEMGHNETAPNEIARYETFPGVTEHKEIAPNDGISDNIRGLIDHQLKDMGEKILAEVSAKINITIATAVTNATNNQFEFIRNTIKSEQETFRNEMGNKTQVIPGIIYDNNDEKFKHLIRQTFYFSFLFE